MTNLPSPKNLGSPGRSVLATTFRLLTFRATSAELSQLTGRHFLFGLLCTWVVGVGRYWDNPRVPLLQHLGIGSLIYIFALSLLIWVVMSPLRPKHWSYFRVLTFVSLVSPPAILYAIPVEYYYSIETADSLNVLFLAIVATWRVALLFFFLRRLGGLKWFSIIAAGLLPLTLIVMTLTILNLERVVFDLMSGIRDETAAASSYFVLIVLSELSFLLFAPLLLCYAVLILKSSQAAGKKAG